MEINVEAYVLEKAFKQVDVFLHCYVSGGFKLLKAVMFSSDIN